MINKDMDDAQGSYNNEGEIKDLHVIMGNAETNFNGRGEKQEFVTMGSLHREVLIYRFDNERIMKAQEEMMQILKMLQKKVNKYSGTNHESSARQVEIYRSHDRRNDHRGSRESRSTSRHQHHHSPGHSNQRKYAGSRSVRRPSVSPIRHQGRRHGSDRLQWELRKIKPPSFDG
jgi:hypothetical protein